MEKRTHNPSRKIENLMTDEAKETFKSTLSKHQTFLAQRAAIIALMDGRSTVGESDIIKAMADSPTKRIRYITEFIACLFLCELITNMITWLSIKYYFGFITAELYPTIGILVAAAISSGGALSVTLYKQIQKVKHC